MEFPIDTLYPYPVVKKESGLKVGVGKIQGKHTCHLLIFLLQSVIENELLFI